MSKLSQLAANRADALQKPVRGYSPASRQAIREEAEAAALAEVDAELDARRRQSEKLRKLRLGARS